MMENYSIGYGELMDFPYEKYLEFAKIISLESKEEKKEAQRKEQEMEKKV